VPRSFCNRESLRRRRIAARRSLRFISIAAFQVLPIFPSDSHLAALTEQWVSLVNTAMDRTRIRTYLYAYIVPQTAGKPDREAIEAVMPAVREQLGILDKAVARTGYLFTYADINLLPILHRVGQFPEGAEALAATINLTAYCDRHAARPSFARTVPPSGPPGRAKQD
jgi:glutathione S-transferase